MFIPRFGRNESGFRLTLWDDTTSLEKTFYYIWVLKKSSDCTLHILMQIFKFVRMSSIATACQRTCSQRRGGYSKETKICRNILLQRLLYMCLAIEINVNNV